MALKYARYGYILENGRVVMDGEAKALRENEDVKEFYLGIAEGKRKSFRDVQALQAPQALAGLVGMSWTPHGRSLRRPWKTRDPGRRASSDAVRAPAGRDRARDDARPAGPSISRASIRNPSPAARRSRSCRCCASPRCSACRRTTPPFGGFNVDAARQGQAAVHVARADLRARGAGGDWQRARARCSPPASAPATSCTTASPII